MNENAAVPTADQQVRAPVVVVLGRSALDADVLVGWLARQGLAARVVGSSAPDGGLGPGLLLVDGDADRLTVRRVVQHWTATGRTALVLVRPSAHEDHASAAAQPGTVHVIPRHAGPRHLLEAVQRALEGRAPRPVPQPTPPAGLTTRELDVLARLAAGDSNHQAATALGISPHTVRTHVQNLLAKLGAEHRLAAVAAARRCGALPGPTDLVGAGHR